MLLAVAAAVMVWSFSSLGTGSLDVKLLDLELRNLVDFHGEEGSDFAFSADLADAVTATEVDGVPTAIPPQDRLFLSVPERPLAACSSLAIAPGLRSDNGKTVPVVTVSPRGGECGLALPHVGAAIATGAPRVIKAGQQLTFILGAGGSAPAPAVGTLFEEVGLRELTGRLHAPITPLKGQTCPGLLLDRLAGSDIRVSRARLVMEPVPHLDVGLTVTGLSALTVSNRDCRQAILMEEVRRWWLALIPLALGGLVGFLRSFVSGRKKVVAPKSRIILPVLLLAAAGGSARAEPPTSPRPRAVLVASWVDCGSRQSDAALGATVREETKALVDALKATGGVEVGPVLWNPPSDEVFRALALGPRGLWFVYSGHGRETSSGSVVCLPDGDVAIDELIERVPRFGTASLWINACASAAVDIARDGVSVVSASPLAAGASAGGTLLGAALLKAIATASSAAGPGGDDCDGMVTDVELFQLIRGAPAGQVPLRPKLRAAWRPLPLFTRGRPDLGCRTPTSSGSAELGSRPPANSVRTGPQREPSPAFVAGEGLFGEPTRRYAGPVTVKQREELRRAGFRACGCEEFSGHCYRRPFNSKEGPP